MLPGWRGGRSCTARCRPACSPEPSRAFTPARAAALPADDWRSREAGFTGEGLRRNLALAAGFAELAAELGAHPAALAVAWTLTVPGVTGAIVGARRPAQVDDWIAAPAVRLGDEELGRIAELTTPTRACLPGTVPTTARTSTASA